MNISLKLLASIVSPLGILTLNFGFSLPVKAEVVCQSGSVSNYTNGQLHRCILAKNLTAQVTVNNASTSTFPCKANSYIFFSDKGQFESCILSAKTQIVQNNSVEVCQANMMVFLATASDGKQSIQCRLV